MIQILVNSIIKELGIKKSLVDKITSLADNVNIHQRDDKTIIEINLNKITITLEKDPAEKD